MLSEFLHWELIVVGIVASAILGVDVYLRWKQHVIEHEFEVKKHESQLLFEEKKHEHELGFQKEKHTDDKKIREEQEKWLLQQKERLLDVSKKIAELAAKELANPNNVDWAVNVMQRAKLGHHAQSIFGDRFMHFEKEKRHLASQFVPILLDRCCAHVKQEKKVFLLIDAGTTMTHFFEQIADKSLVRYERGEDWFSDLQIATNNLPGVEIFTKHGRIKPHNPYSKLVIECELFPGMILPVFAMVTGDETVRAINEFRSRQESIHGADRVYFIDLVVGNWICTGRHEPYLPIPLARGFKHGDIKEALIRQADEIFVVTPLGKIFCRADSETVNPALECTGNTTESSVEPYREVKIDADRASRIKLVSTSRKATRVLGRHSDRVKDMFSIKADSHSETYATDTITDLPHVMYEFNDLPDNWHDEFDVEFPHEITRREEFVGPHFQTSTVNPFHG